MLTIRRIPTIVSNYQESLELHAGCGRNCLGPCCIPGAKLPLYLFGKSSHTKKHDEELGEKDHIELGQTNSFLDCVILSQWEERQSKGLFRYDVTTCETKVLPGEYGFIAQLNEGRHMKKRPTEFRVDQVLQPFDPHKFNFTKVGQEELLFAFEQSQDDCDHYYEKAVVKGSPNVVVINVSPIEYGHVLLVPRVLDCIPQQMECDTLLLALHMAAEADNPYFRLGYNSLGAFATINHLHFQAYYLGAPFPVERAPLNVLTRKQKKGVKVKVYEVANYPVKGVVYEVGSGGSCFEELSVAVAKACKLLQSRNVPFNLLITDRGCRVFLFPQCFAEKQARGEVEKEIMETQVNPAVWEISGHIVLKRKEDYERASEEYAWRLLAEVSVCESVFEDVKKICLMSVDDDDDDDGYGYGYDDGDDDDAKKSFKITYYTLGKSKNLTVNAVPTCAPVK